MKNLTLMVGALVVLAGCGGMRPVSVAANVARPAVMADTGCSKETLAKVKTDITEWYTAQGYGVAAVYVDANGTQDCSRFTYTAYVNEPGEPWSMKPHKETGTWDHRAVKP